MKKIVLLSLVVVAAAFVNPPAEPITEAERTFATDYFNKTKTRLVNNLNGLSDAQLNFKADSTRWSVAQCLEHIALAETFLWNWIHGSIQSPATPEKSSLVKLSPEQIITGVTDRSKKFNAPEPLQPKAKFENSKVALASFTSRRDSTIQFIKTTQAGIKDHFITHPALGTLDAYKALIFLSAHCERHTIQLEEVMAHPGFPKK